LCFVFPYSKSTPASLQRQLFITHLQRVSGSVCHQKKRFPGNVFAHLTHVARQRFPRAGEKQKRNKITHHSIRREQSLENPMTCDILLALVFCVRFKSHITHPQLHALKSHTPQTPTATPSRPARPPPPEPPTADRPHLPRQSVLNNKNTRSKYAL
jgi:hypothetical protein